MSKMINSTVMRGNCGVVIVGGGQAGGQAALMLRSFGFDDSVTLLCAENTLPYQRSPLSKGFLYDRTAVEQLWLAKASDFTDRDIDVEVSARVKSIDRSANQVKLASGGQMSYEHLILATGSRNRRSSMGRPMGVCGLRTVGDAVELRERMRTAEQLVVIGGGFIGLEIAAMAAQRGTHVDVVEMFKRPMARVLSEPASTLLLKRHRYSGIVFHLRRVASAFRAVKNVVAGVQLDDGVVLPADLVIIGVGAVPNSELAQAAGLAVEGRILVDRNLRTCHANITAMGDCATFPSGTAAGHIRLESVQNAITQAEYVSKLIAGQSQPDYEVVPWFWSDQGSTRVQIAGLSSGHDCTVLRTDSDGAKASIYCFHESRLVSVESIDSPTDHMAARRAFIGASDADET